MASLVLTAATLGGTTAITPTDQSGVVNITLPSTGGTLQTSGAGFTTNGVAYATSTSALATGSALQFDGTNLSLGASASTIGAKLKVKTATRTAKFLDLEAVGGENWVIDSTNTVSSTDVLGIYAYGATGMYLTDAGNVGIGETSPGSKLEVSNTVNTAYDSTNTLTSGQTARITNLSTTSGVASTLFFKAVGSGGDNSYATISCASLGTGASALTFGVKQASGYGVVEAMRIDPSGNLNINGTANNGAKVNIYCTDNVSNALNVQVFSNGNNAVGFKNASGSQVGSIGINASTTSYNTSSDYRLKENIAPMTGALVKVTQLKPVTYKWKVDGADGEGFIAHELAEVCPHAVSGTKDEVDADGNPKYQGIDTSFLVATLTSAIQELSALVTAQSATITSLTERITALEGK